LRIFGDKPNLPAVYAARVVSFLVTHALTNGYRHPQYRQATRQVGMRSYHDFIGCDAASRLALRRALLPPATRDNDSYQCDPFLHVTTISRAPQPEYIDSIRSLYFRLT
jgi:hypothetical protein